MKRFCILITFFILGFSFQLSAQRWVSERNQYIVGMGITGFMGDLGGANDIGSNGIRDFDFGCVRPGLMLAYRYHLTRNIALRANLAFGYLHGNDALTNEPFRNNRNIRFRSPLVESSLQGEYYFWIAERPGARFRKITRLIGWIGWQFKAYAFAGVGGIYFEPQARFEAANFNPEVFAGSIPEQGLPADGWYNLRPLRTEGQGYFPTRKRYSPLELVVPLGIGVSLSVSRDLTLGMEYGFRKTFTDYIDDVSTTYVDPEIFGEMFDDPKKVFLARYFANPTLGNNTQQTLPGYQRGNPLNDDAYMFLVFSASYKFPSRRFRGIIPGL